MKHVGAYALLFANSSQKTIWKQYGFLKLDEQFNVIFAVLLYLMEQSLKEENCTIDDIGAYLDSLNMRYFEKKMGYEDCKNLGDFIINVVLSNEGKAMYFEGYDFGQREYQVMNVSYVANKIVYLDSEVRRTSYYLTEDGYNLLLSTLEIESNLKITIHEMIFKMHLEKQSYDKAVDDIKNVFNLMRIQLQRIEEAMGRIRRNALNYSVADYENVLETNLDTISDTKQKFLSYRELVKTRAREPMGSRWARGLRVVRPRSLAVWSPIQEAARPWAHSCMGITATRTMARINICKKFCCILSSSFATGHNPPQCHHRELCYSIIIMSPAGKNKWEGPLSPGKEARKIFRKGFGEKYFEKSLAFPPCIC